MHLGFNIFLYNNNNNNNNTLLKVQYPRSSVDYTNYSKEKILNYKKNSHKISLMKDRWYNSSQLTVVTFKEVCLKLRFKHHYPNCQNYPINAIQMNTTVWALWEAIKNYQKVLCKPFLTQLIVCVYVITRHPIMGFQSDKHRYPLLLITTVMTPAFYFIDFATHHAHWNVELRLYFVIHTHID